MKKKFKGFSKNIYIAISIFFMFIILLVAAFAHDNEKTTAAYAGALGDTNAQVIVADRYMDALAADVACACDGKDIDYTYKYIADVMSNYTYCSDDEINKAGNYTKATVFTGMTYNTMVCRGFAALSAKLWRACGYDATMEIGYYRDDNSKSVRQHAWTVLTVADGRALPIDYTCKVSTRANKLPSCTSFYGDGYITKTYTTIGSYNGNIENDRHVDAKYATMDAEGVFTY